MAAGKDRRPRPAQERDQGSGRDEAKADLASRARQDDRSFGRVLQTRSPDRIVPETVRRLEGGRRLYLEESLRAAEAELLLLTKERDRLQEEGDKRRLARIARLVAAVEADLAAGRETAAAVKQSGDLPADGWAVLGRVLTRDGDVPQRAEVVFVAEEGRPVEPLQSLPVGPDGMVRAAFPAEVVKPLEQQALRVAAAVRVGRRILAVDETPVRLRAGRVYQFDLRVEPATERCPTDRD